MPVKRDQDAFWSAIDEGRFVAQKCAQCGALRHPPAPNCARCGSGRWDLQTLSGRGTILSWVISRHPSQIDDDPKTVILVALEEGLHFVSILVDREQAAIGATVEAEIVRDGGNSLPVFRTAPQREDVA